MWKVVTTVFILPRGTILVLYTQHLGINVVRQQESGKYFLRLRTFDNTLHFVLCQVLKKFRIDRLSVATQGEPLYPKTKFDLHS